MNFKEQYKKMLKTNRVDTPLFHVDSIEIIKSKITNRHYIKLRIGNKIHVILAEEFNFLKNRIDAYACIYSKTHEIGLKTYVKTIIKNNKELHRVIEEYINITQGIENKKEYLINRWIETLICFYHGE